MRMVEGNGSSTLFAPRLVPGHPPTDLGKGIEIQLTPRKDGETYASLRLWHGGKTPGDDQMAMPHLKRRAPIPWDKQVCVEDRNATGERNAQQPEGSGIRKG